MFLNSKRFLSDILQREGNNFDLLRLFAAFAVIVGHAYAIAPQPPLQDAVLTWLHFDYSGSLAIKFFFFLSGLLVTDSIIRRPAPIQFLARRALRIFPGLIACLMVSVFIVGPVFTTLSIGDYFSQADTWTYLLKNSLLVDLQWKLPGVFSESKYGLNGSLWTLPYESICYLYIAIFCGLGLFSIRYAANLIFIGIVATAFLSPHYLPRFAQNPESFLLPACFALGALFAINKNLIKIDLQRVALLWIFVSLVNEPSTHIFLFYIAFFYTTIFVASLGFVINRLRLPFDASYGVYVYGFMIQQCVRTVFPGAGVHGNQLISIILALLIGAVSWFLVEKPAIAFGGKLMSSDSITLILFNKFRSAVGLSSTDPAEKNTLKLRFGMIELGILTVLALVIHALVLKFIFPGYYSPLWPHHSDHYLPAALANSSDGIFSYAHWPRPVGMTFFVLIGFLGTKGSIAVIVGLTAVNCVLSAMLARRILKIDLKWPFVMAFIIYLYLLYSQAHFYGFYSQDAFAQLSYFFLINAAWSFLLLHERSTPIAGIVLFLLALLAFLTKETYGLSALAVAAAWFFFYRKKYLIRAGMPVLVVACALLVSLGYSALINSIFVTGSLTSHDSPYKVNLTPSSVFGEWSRYASEGLNLANIGILAIIALTLYFYSRNGKRKAVYVFFGCILAAFLAWIPNALLPNHHFSGYSWSGSYILFLPVLLLPMLVPEFWQRNGWLRYFSTILIFLFLLNPILNKAQYSKNNWLLFQEKTQRNLLTSLDGLMERISSDGSEKILVTGLSFPFSPFVHPLSLRTFPNMHFANFDVVTYSSEHLGERTNLVKFIGPSNVVLQDYSQVWMFASDGHLVRALRTGDPALEPALGFEPQDWILFPDVADVLGLTNATRVSPAILDDGYRLLKCGTAFSSYQQPGLALRCFDASILKIPENPYPWYQAGLELERLARIDEAKSYFVQAVARDTNESNPAFKEALLRVERRMTVPLGLPKNSKPAAVQ